MEKVANRKKEEKKREKIELFAKVKKQKRNPAFAEFFVTEEEKNSEKPPLEEKDGEITLKELTHNGDLFDFGALSNYEVDGNLEAKVIEAKGNIYLRYPILKLKNRHLKELENFRPEYEIRESFSDENKQARFLLRLFDQRSFASFLKAKKIYKKTFPDSKYDQILDYVEADVWLELWKLKKNRMEFFDKATNLYRKLIEKYPYSKITERTLVYVGLLAHDVGRYFLAAKLLKRYLKNYPTSPFNNYTKIYLADSLTHMKNYQRARSLYEEVVKDNELGSREEAEYRIGDIYFLKQNFRRAERAYKKAIGAYPKKQNNFPNAWFNMAESQFNLAEYPASLKSYKAFVKKYPTDPFKWFSTHSHRRNC